MAINASSAMAATDQGKAVDIPVGRAAGLPAGVPHRWQNLAPGVSGARQAAHAAPCRGAAQFAQKFPVPSVPQLGQTMPKLSSCDSGLVICDWPKFRVPSHGSLS